MQAFGSDRVRQGDGEQIVLSSRLSKGWTPRVEKTLTSAEFPGTAILWEECYFEVVSVEDLQHGGVRYVLEPWRDHDAMRVTDRYDAESEAGRVEEHRRSLKQESAMLLDAAGFRFGVVAIGDAHRVVIPPGLEHVSHAAVLQILDGHNLEVALLPQDRGAGELRRRQSLLDARRPALRQPRGKDDLLAVPLAD